LFLTPTRRPIPLIATAIIAVVLVVVFGKFIAPTAAISSWDAAVSHSFNVLHAGALGFVSTALYSVFEPPFAIAITVILSAALWLVTRNIRLGVSFGAVIAITWLPTVVVKLLVHRPRPNPLMLAHPFAVQPDASYPSGHVAFITALVVVLILLARGHRYGWVVVVLGSLLVVVLGVALIIDGVHFPTDVIASVVWSAGLAPLVLFLWTRFVIPLTRRSPSREG
jgi:undecaprenyl-diphosphatase